MKIGRQEYGIYTGNNGVIQNTNLKSSKERLQRQAKRDAQIEFLENQKSSLKNMECSSMDDISRKLEMFHSYESQIAAVKEAYNNSQVFHVLDEAKERGEQMAKAAEKYEPKTPKERWEELLEETYGTDESKGELTEMLEELTGETPEELTGEIPEELTGKMPEELTGETPEELTGEIPEELTGETPEELTGETPEERQEDIVSDAQKSNIV